MIPNTERTTSLDDHIYGPRKNKSYDGEYIQKEWPQIIQ